MTSAALGLIGLFVALYLWLWKIGALGVLACGDGACETVQLSPYAEFLGQPVALYGVVGYAAIVALSLAGLQGSLARRRWPITGVLVLSGVGVLFTAYLSYLEAAVIHAWCRWCLVSAVLIAAIFISALLGWRSWKPGAVG